MTDQPRPPEPSDDPGAADPGHDRKTPAKRVTLGTGESMILAGYVRRLCARIADTFVYVIGFAVLLQIDTHALDLQDALVLTMLFTPIINEVVAVAYCGRTLGMQLLDIRIVSKETAKKPTVIAAFFRWVFQALFFLFILGEDPSELDGGLAMMGWVVIGICWWLLVHFSVYLGDRRRGWHDLISGTVVVTADPSYPVEPLDGDAV